MMKDAKWIEQVDSVSSDLLSHRIMLSAISIEKIWKHILHPSSGRLGKAACGTASDVSIHLPSAVQLCWCQACLGFSGDLNRESLPSERSRSWQEQQAGEAKGMLERAIPDQKKTGCCISPTYLNLPWEQYFTTGVSVSCYSAWLWLKVVCFSISNTLSLSDILGYNPLPRVFPHFSGQPCSHSPFSSTQA